MKEADLRQGLRGLLDESCSPGAQPILRVLELIFWRERYWFPRLRAKFVLRTDEYTLLAANEHVLTARRNTKQVTSELGVGLAPCQSDPDFLAEIGRAHEERYQMAANAIIAALKRSDYID